MRSLREHFPTISRFFDKLKGVKNAPRTLQERADELTNTLGRFLPRSLAVAITGRVFRLNKAFDLQSPENELTRYLLNQACNDFLDKVAWLTDRLGHEMAIAWVRAVREGRELFFPSYLQGCFGIVDGEDGDGHRGGGR